MPENEVKKRLIEWDHVCQSWFHSRKATIYLVVFALTNTAFFLKLINADQWIDAVKWATGSYMAANVASGVAAGLTGKDDNGQQ